MSKIFSSEDAKVSKTKVKKIRPKLAPVPKLNFVPAQIDGTASGNAGQGVQIPLERYYQDLSLVEAEMDLFERNIDESIVALHTEIKERVESGNAEDQPVILPEHLDKYISLPTPLPSPTPAIANKTSADLDAALEVQTKLHQSLLKTKSFGDLLHRDNYFHILLNALDGLRQWWITCRAEWRDRRDELAVLEKSLNA